MCSGHPFSVRVTSLRVTGLNRIDANAVRLSAVGDSHERHLVRVGRSALGEELARLLRPPL